MRINGENRAGDGGGRAERGDTHLAEVALVTQTSLVFGAELRGEFSRLRREGMD